MVWEIRTMEKVMAAKAMTKTPAAMKATAGATDRSSDGLSIFSITDFPKTGAIATNYRSAPLVPLILLILHRIAAAAHQTCCVLFYGFAIDGLT